MHLPPGDTSTERTVHIEGTSEQVEAAKQLVNEVTSEVCLVDVSLQSWVRGTPKFCCFGTLNFQETVPHAYYDLFYSSASIGFFCRVSYLVVNMWLEFIFIILIVMLFFLII